MTNRQLFQQYVAQTSPSPVGLEIVSAEGNYLYDADGKKYLDLMERRKSEWKFAQGELDLVGVEK
mgnify:CR=1 FL=1